MREIRWLTPASLLVLMLLGPLAEVSAWGNSDSVLLKDIEVLTLYAGKMTNGKRSSPVPQLECVKGGTAPCDAFRPRVVQCYNRGWDGVDVQWECKTDMDNEFRFGEVEVSCEGYSNRDDPYVLRGSCGLRYSLDYTKEGFERNKGNQHDYYPNQNYHSGNQGYGWSYQNNKNDKLSSASFFANMIVYAAVVLMCYAFYKTCIGSRRNVGQDAYSTTDGDYPAGGGGGGAGGGYGWFGGNYRPTAPPAPGFRPEYTDDASCGRNRTGNAGGGGFWTGAAAGGLLGYMFGNRGQNNYGHRAGGWGNTGWGNSGWGGGGGGFTARSSGGGGGGGGGGSSGTRTASGFGGTSRR